MKKLFRSFTENHAEIWKFIKFILTCGGSTIVYFTIFYLCKLVLFKNLNDTQVADNSVLTFLGIENNVGTALSYFIASLCSFSAAYVVNRKVTFKSNSNILSSTILYAIMTVFTVAFQAWSGAFATTVLQKNNLSGGFLENVVLPCVIPCIPFLWTYPLQRFVIYKNKKPDSDEEQEKEDKGE